MKHETDIGTGAMRPVHWLLGLPFDAVTRDDAVRIIAHSVRTRTPLFLSTPNLNFLIASQRDKAFQASVLNSDLSVADGMPIVWMARLLGIPIPERVAGSDIFEALLRGEAGPLDVYLFGGDDGVAARAAERINALGGPVRCVGHRSPGFGSIEDMSTPAIIEEINASGADFVLVALGAAKGQAWIEHNRGCLSAPVVSHLGAVINFAAGTVSRAPAWMQKCGLEWVWRIKEEPQLVRRYARDGLALAGMLARNVLPLMLARFFGKSRREPGCRLETIIGADSAVVDIQGSWQALDARELVAHLDAVDRRASARELRIDRLKDRDTALLGLIHLMTSGHGISPRCIRVVDTPSNRRWVALNKAEVLVDMN